MSFFAGEVVVGGVSTRVGQAVAVGQGGATLLQTLGPAQANRKDGQLDREIIHV